MKNNYLNFNTILIVFIVTIGTILLIGLRFDAKWAGGEGYTKQLTATVGSEVFKRGEVVNSETNVIVELPIGSICIEAGSELELLSITADETAVNLRTGRIFTMDTFRIHMQDREFISDQNTSYIHYSWLNIIEIINLETGMRERVDVTENTLETSLFDAETSSAAEFYRYCDSELNKLN